MTKDGWVKHIQEATGIRPPSQGGYMDLWAEAIRTHRSMNPDCPDCKARLKTRRAGANRKAREDAYRSVGLVKVRGALGGIYWE